jgi:hypothetical protein
MAFTMRISAFTYVTPCSLEDMYRSCKESWVIFDRDRRLYLMGLIDSPLL